MRLVPPGADRALARLQGAGRPADPAPRSASVQRLRDKYEAELSELERSERRLQDQCAELKGRLAEAEAESARLQGLVRQKDKALADVQAVSGRCGRRCPASCPRGSRPWCHPGERAAGG